MLFVSTTSAVPTICPECQKPTGTTVNGFCYDCFSAKQTAWQERMAIRMDAAQFKPQRLVNLLLTQHWMHECQIIRDYMPPFPRPDTKPICVVAYTYKSGTVTFLRYSQGPLQGYSWDIYGDDMHSPELALLALSQAIAPPRVDGVIPTYGN